MPINSGSKMTWCSHCGKNCVTHFDYTINMVSCAECGKVLFDYSAEGAHQLSTSVRIESDYFELQRRNVAIDDLLYKNRIPKVSHTTRHYKGRDRIFCPHCARKGKTFHDNTRGIIHCADCGKILSEDTYTEKETFFNEAPGGKDKTKLSLDAKSLKPLKTAAEAVSRLSRKKRSSSKINYEVLNTSFNNMKILNKRDHAFKDPEKEDSVDAYSIAKGHERDYVIEHESCDSNYEYDGSDEYDDYKR